MDVMNPMNVFGSEQTPQLSLSDPVPTGGNAGTGTGTTTAAQRKKFAKPPVKNACLSCRGSRIRCDGQQPCLNCTEKHKDCKYEKSRRGGPRVPSSRKRQGARNSSSDGEEVKQESPQLPLSIEDQFMVATELKEAGAGLRHLDEPDEILGFLNFADRFDNCGANIWDGCNLPTMLDVPEDGAFDYQSGPWDAMNNFALDEDVPSEVRSYETEADLLDAYYVWIHAYFPVLPPPVRAPIDRPRQKSFASSDWMPSTPLTLALSALLALIPLQDDPNASSSQSTWDRRFQAQKHAQAAFTAIDEESELADSNLNPKDALSNAPKGPGTPYRRHFHRNLPLDLETNVTLMLLSVYEYTQRGNIKKMMNRGGQSLMMALEAKLYQPKNFHDDFQEARSRVWWTTYINVCQGSIASNSACALDLFDPKFTIAFPNIAADKEAFPFFIRCQRAIVQATQYVLDHTEILEHGGDLSAMYQRTVEMEELLANLAETADVWFVCDRSPVDTPVDAGEWVVAKTLRAIARMKINSARIKIHRYSAFIDQPVFNKRHCDLEPKVQQQQHQVIYSSPTGSNANSSMNGSNSQFSGSGREGSMSSANTPLSGDGSNYGSMSGRSHLSSMASYGSEIQPMCSLPAQAPAHLIRNVLPTPPAETKLPYSSKYSVQICCKAALDIAETFSMLPYPNPTGIIQSRNPVYNPADPLNPRNLTSTNYANPYGLEDLSGAGALRGGVGMARIGGGLDMGAIARTQVEGYGRPPRTMPTFACCAMQAAYALLMGLYGVYMSRQNGEMGDAMLDGGMDSAGRPKSHEAREKEVREHVERLREGLGGVVAALQNWAQAFEAIDGMREEVSNALTYNVVRFDEPEFIGAPAFM